MRSLPTLCLSLCLLLLSLACGDGKSPGPGTPPPDSSRWTELAPLQNGPRQEHSVVALGDKVYVIAGVETTSVNTGRVDVYDTLSNTWTEAAPLPLPMNHPNIAVVGEKIYVVGGMTGDFPWAAVGNVFEFDPRTNVWTELAPMPAGTERGSAAVGVSGTKIYLAGGLRSLTNEFLQDTVATFSSYDVVQGTWETLTSLPEPRDHVGGAIVDGTFYVLGGRANGIANVKDTVFAYNLSTGSWSSRAPMPTPRGGVAAAALGTKIYVIGGEGNPAPGALGVYADNEAYDTVSDSWQVLAPMPTPRHGTGAATIGSTIYVPGGGVETRNAPGVTNEAFTP